MDQHLRYDSEIQGWDQQSNRNPMADTRNSFQSQNRARQSMVAAVNDGELSVWSEDQMHQALSQRNAQNPQGEEEEIKESASQLQLIL